MSRAPDSDHDGPLYLSDAELVKRLGIGEKTGRVAFRELERARGFPQKDPLFADKRYWPAVKAFLDRRSGVSIGATSTPDGMEKNNGQTTDRQRARPRMATTR